MTLYYAVQLLSVMEYYRRVQPKESHEPNILTLRSVQEKCDIKSLHLLEQVASTLRRKGIIRSFKGPSGGYALTKDPSNVTIGDIDAAPDSVDKNAPNTNVATEIARKFYTCSTAFYSIRLCDIPNFGTKKSFSSILK